MKAYINGNYRVYLNEDGTKIRYTNDDVLIPDRPESLDCCITERCKMNCSFCYANCTPTGRHAQLFDDNWEPMPWIKSIPKYCELAINGNDLDHPQLDQFLIYCAENDIIVNMTLHQAQFMKNIGKVYAYIKAEVIKGVGVSITDPSDELIYMLRHIPNVVCHVIAGIVTPDIIEKLSHYRLNLLILGYKQKGRGVFKDIMNERMVTSNILRLENIIMEKIYDFKSVMFDCLACEQLHMKDKISEKDWNKLYMGNDGTTTFYIDAVNNKYAKSSTETEYYDMNDMTINEMFKTITK